MIILKRCFYIFFICILAFQTLSAFPQQESSPFGLSPDEGEVVESENEAALKAQYEESSGESFDHALPFFPFMPYLDEIIIPGQIRLDDSTLDLIYQFQLNRGIKNFTTFTTFLINRTQQAIERGEKNEAIRLAQAAIRMAPQFPQPYWALAKAYWSESKINFYRVIKEYFKGYSIALRNFRSLLLMASNVYFLLYLSFFLTVITFALIILGKYFSLLVNDISRFLGQNANPFIVYIWAGVIILFPFIFGFAPILVACYWLVILSVYATRKERGFILAFLLIFVLLPLSLRTAASMVLANQPGIIVSLHRANNEDWSPEIKQKLESWLMENPQDRSLLFTLGLIEKRMGNYDKAKWYYQKLLELNPNDAVVIGNLANVYLAEGELEKAMKTYEEAIKIDNRIASFHYNLYKTYVELYKFLEAQQKQEFAIARKLDPELIEYQEKIFNPNINNRMVIDETLTFKQLWEKAFSPSKEREKVASSLWNFLVKGIPYKYGAFVFILFPLLFSLFFLKNIQRKFSTRCIKCGNPMKKRFIPKQSLKFPDLCFPCINIFLEKKKVDQRVKDKKVEQVEKHQKREDLIWKSITYGIPGGGHLWMGFPGWATLFLFIFFCFILKIVFWNGILKDPFSLYSSGSLFKIILFCLLLLVFYFFAVWHSYYKREELIQYFQEQFSQFLKDKSSEQKVGSKKAENLKK